MLILMNLSGSVWVEHYLPLMETEKYCAGPVD